MTRKATNLQTRLYLVAAIVLLLGMSGAVLVYLTAENEPDSVLGYENSKRYIHDLELYGGKANVLANEFERWVAGLWHGKSLAFTVAGITIFISFGFFLAARHLRAHIESDAGDEDNRV